MKNNPPEIRRHAVSSTNVRSAGYDPVSKTLSVEFHSGGVYDYKNVSQKTALEFQQAKSKGSFIVQIQKSHLYTRIK
jgi:hypothetical protein